MISCQPECLAQITMKMIMEVNPLTEAAAILARSAPLEFRQFVEAMKLYAENLAYETVAMDDREQLRIVQGRARQVAKELRWYIELITPPKPRPT